MTSNSTLVLHVCSTVLNDRLVLGQWLMACQTALRKNTKIHSRFIDCRFCVLQRVFSKNHGCPFQMKSPSAFLFKFVVGLAQITFTVIFLLFIFHSIFFRFFYSTYITKNYQDEFCMKMQITKNEMVTVYFNFFSLEISFSRIVFLSANTDLQFFHSRYFIASNFLGVLEAIS